MRASMMWSTRPHTGPWSHGIHEDRNMRTRRWIIAVSIAEAAGFAVAASVAIATISAGIDGPPGFALTVAGGAVEGTLLGLGQWYGMSGSRPPLARWVAATAGGGAVAWSIGMLPSTIGLDFAQPATYVFVAVGGLALLATIPTAQWLALHRAGTVSWIPVNMGAWAAAILWTFAPSPFIDETSPVWLVALLYVIAGILMAVTIAVLTARTAVRFFPRDG